jgi:hypothetical protein
MFLTKGLKVGLRGISIENTPPPAGKRNEEREKCKKKREKWNEKGNLH